MHQVWKTRNKQGSVKLALSTYISYTLLLKYSYSAAIIISYFIKYFVLIILKNLWMPKLILSPWKQFDENMMNVTIKMPTAIIQSLHNHLGFNPFQEADEWPCDWKWTLSYVSTEVCKCLFLNNYTLVAQNPLTNEWHPYPLVLSALLTVGHILRKYCLRKLGNLSSKLNRNTTKKDLNKNLKHSSNY